MNNIIIWVLKFAQNIGGITLFQKLCDMLNRINQNVYLWILDNNFSTLLTNGKYIEIPTSYDMRDQETEILITKDLLHSIIKRIFYDR